MYIYIYMYIYMYIYIYVYTYIYIVGLPMKFLQPAGCASFPFLYFYQYSHVIPRVGVKIGYPSNPQAPSSFFPLILQFLAV